MGSVSTQAIKRLRTVAICRPDPLAAIVPATPDDRTCETGSPNMSAPGDRAHGAQLGACPLSIGQMRFADLLPDRHHDALPADHGAEPERDGDRDLDPERDVFGGVVELPL